MTDQRPSADDYAKRWPGVIVRPDDPTTLHGVEDPEHLSSLEAYFVHSDEDDGDENDERA